MKRRPAGGVVVKVHFPDYFDVEPKVLSDHGAFNVSLINDLPLFVDPFLFAAEQVAVVGDQRRTQFQCGGHDREIEIRLQPSSRS